MLAVFIFAGIFGIVILFTEFIISNSRNSALREIHNKYKGEEFDTQRRNRRDRKFSFFSLEPAPLLQEKFLQANKLRDVLMDVFYLRWFLAFYLSILVTAFILIIFRVTDSPENVRNLKYIVAVFGVLFLLLERKLRWYLEESQNKKNKDISPYKVKRNPGFLFWVFLVFVIFVPTLNYTVTDLFPGKILPYASQFELNPEKSKNPFIYTPEVATDIICPEPGTNKSPEECATAKKPPLGGKLEAMIESARFAVLIFPIILFTFYIIEVRAFARRVLFETDEVGLSSVSRIKHLVTWVIAILITLVVSQVDLSGLSLFSGLAAAGLSVAMRESLNNFISGLQMTWDKSLRVGDVISIPQSISEDTGSTYGIVRDIRSRYTVIEDRNTVRRLVPNSLLVSQTIEHWTHADSSVRLSLLIGIPYVKDPQQVRLAQRIMENVCYDVPRVLTEKTPSALLIGYGESDLTFALRFWIDDAHNGIRPVISEVLITLYEKLTAAGIPIPFPQRDIHIKELPGGFKSQSDVHVKGFPKMVSDVHVRDLPEMVVVERSKDVT